MNETENNQPCCKEPEAAPSCECSVGGCDCGKPVRREPPKVVICLVILLAVIAFITCRLWQTRSNTGDGGCCPAASSSCCPEN